MLPWRRMTTRRVLKRLAIVICIIAVVQWLNASLVRDDSPGGAAGLAGNGHEGLQSFREGGDALGLQDLHDPAQRKPLALRTSAAAILDQMGQQWHWEWIRGRVQRTWEEVVIATQTLHAKQDLTRGTVKKVVIIPGLLTQTDFAAQESIRSGGPLGDLLQWADLISGLHVLGHDVILYYTIHRAAHELMTSYLVSQLINGSQSEGCRDDSIDLIYTDIGGWQAMHPTVREQYRFKFRILDAFGTEAMYNDPDYAYAHGIDISGKGGLGINLKQFYTFYPHTPDNSFLGFIVPGNTVTYNTTHKQGIAILYGKEARYAKDRQKFLEVLLRLVEVHSTMDNIGPMLSSAIKNHGVLSHEQYQQLAASAKIFVGLGAPIEANGVMESLARGCIFFNPKLKQDEFHGKPTTRQPSSQMPYLEQYVGRPHVFTIDYDEVDEVTAAVKEALSLRVEPLLPYEFSAEGFLQRLDAYLQKQNFCKTSDVWPPLEALSEHIAPPGVSCKEYCQQQDLVCEPSFFHALNHTSVFARLGKPCSRGVITVPELHAPAFLVTNRTCALQQRRFLFSCVGASRQAERLCPCRDFVKYQIALCKDCV